LSSGSDFAAKRVLDLILRIKAYSYPARKHLPTPGNGGRPGKACCRAAASPFGKPCGGIVKCSGSARRSSVAIENIYLFY